VTVNDKKQRIETYIIGVDELDLEPDAAFYENVFGWK
jgi:predicted enzyme related to lactoylglutathione lyase